MSLAVFDLAGRRVATLLDHELVTAGTHEAVLDSRGLPAGIYLYRLSAGLQSTTRKMVVVK